jgi:glyoxylase-like metal-dependent hydrolase (beta-lactamase superfamily II)
MKILNVTDDSKIYTSNVYLVTGASTSMDDVNTLIDVGRDPSVIEKINNALTGMARPMVDQVILTHSHHDHITLLPLIREIFNPAVYAFSPFLDGTYHLLRHGQTLKVGDRKFEVIYTPGHSSDSICLYCEEDGVLFAGDTPLVVTSADSSYEEGYVHALETLSRSNIRSIYFGHGDPMFHDCDAQIRSSLEHVRRSKKNAKVWRDNE